MSAAIQDSTGRLAAGRMASADLGREAAALLSQARARSDRPEDQQKARDAAHRLEGLFATLLVKEMRGTQSAGLFGEGTSADVYGGWFDQYLGEVLAKHGELHLANSIESSLGAKTKETPRP